MAKYSKAEVRQIEADRDWWKSLIKNDDYELIGFTYRNEASFRKIPGGGSIEVTRSHLKMLGIIE